MYKVHHICFCYYADYDPSGNSNIVQFGEKRNTKQIKKKKNQPKIKLEKITRNVCVLKASTLSSLPLPLLLMSDILCYNLKLKFY